VVKRGRKRTLENTGIVLDAQRRFRIEAYGPLGESILAVVWDGRQVLARLPGNDRVVRHGTEELERLLGEGLEVQELSALLSGNIPAGAMSSDARLFCGQNNDCVLELSRGEKVRFIRVVLPVGPEDLPRLVSYDLFVSGRPVYQARFEQNAEIRHYPLPMNITIRNPDKKLLLTVQYTDVTVNARSAKKRFYWKINKSD